MNIPNVFLFAFLFTFFGWVAGYFFGKAYSDIGNALKVQKVIKHYHGREDRASVEDLIRPIDQPLTEERMLEISKTVENRMRGANGRFVATKRSDEVE